MKHNAFRMDFTPKELRYFLFGKKICPRCGGMMDRSREFETRQGCEFHDREPFIAGNARVKYYFYVFTCQECGRKYRLSELAE